MTAQTKVEAATLHSAMALAFPEIEGATKDKTNPAFKSKYADLGSVVEAIKPALAKHGLFFTQHNHPCEGGVSVETFVRHASGESLSFGALFVPATKHDAQGYGSALTYARRYSLMTAFGVAPEDDDGNAAARSAPVPFANEAPPAKPEKLEGPYSSPSTLKAAIRAFAESLRIYEDDLAGFGAWMATPEVVELEKAALRYLPEWWETGEGMPDTYEPIASRIHRKKRALEEGDNVHAIRTILDAG